MNEYLLFNQTLESLRHVGRRGGKATARNRRARQITLRGLAAPSSAPITTPVETTAEAIAQLDVKFPWLRNGERRCDLRR